MAKIKEIIGMDNRKTYARVSVLMEDGTEAWVYVGGECEVFFHKGSIKAFVKKP